MNFIIYTFLILSGVGLFLSIISHICGLMGVWGPLGAQTWLLHMGIFVVWLPAIFAAQKLSKNVPAKDYWRATLRGCPAWMKYAFYGIAIYAAFNFVVFLLLTVGKPQGSGPMPPGVVRGFSGHWMIFYGAAFAILYSYLQVGGGDAVRRCVAGHEVSVTAKFCEQCGQPVIERNTFGGRGKI